MDLQDINILNEEQEDAIEEIEDQQTNTELDDKAKQELAKKDALIKKLLEDNAKQKEHIINTRREAKQEVKPVEYVQSTDKVSKLEKELEEVKKVLGTYATQNRINKIYSEIAKSNPDLTPTAKETILKTIENKLSYQDNDIKDIVEYQIQKMKFNTADVAEIKKPAEIVKTPDTDKKATEAIAKKAATQAFSTMGFKPL